MLKNITRRTWSVLIALVMIWTTFCIGQPLTASAAVTASTPSNVTGVNFVVPEAIYLKPLYNSYNASTTSSFQWYVNNTLDSSGNVNVRTGEENQGDIYFRYSNATNAKISFEWLSTSGQAAAGGSIKIGGSLTAMGNSKEITSSSNPIRITEGTSPSLASTVTGAYIRWTVSYTDTADGRDKTVQAYTYVYKPYVEPVGSAIKTLNDRGDNHYGGNLSWICGVHDADSAALGDYYPKSGTSNGLMAISSSDSSGAASGDLYAQIPDRFQRTASNEGPQNWITTDSSTGMPDKTFRFVSNEKDGYSSGDVAFNTFVYSGTGFMTIDISRYTNLEQIPNLSLGLMVTDDEDSDSGAAYFVANYTGTPAEADDSDYNKSWDHAQGIWNKYNEDTIWSEGTPNNRTASEAEGVKYNGKWPKAISGTGTSTYYVGTGYLNHQGSDTIWNNAELRMKVTRYDKGSLRTAVKKAINNSATLQAAFYDTNSSAWEKYVNLYKAAGMALTKLDGTFSIAANGTTYTSPSTLATALSGAVDTLLGGSGRLTNRTATQTNIVLQKVSENAYVYAPFLNGTTTRSTTFKSFDIVTFTADAVPGYTFMGLKRASSAPQQPTSGTSADDPTSTFTTSEAGATINGGTVKYTHTDTTGTDTQGNIYYTYYYLANTYTVHFEPNANGTTGSMQDQAFTYNVAQNLTGNRFERQGYVFAGWAKSASGSKVYSDCENVNNLTTTANGTVNLYALWTTEDYTILYDTAGGSLSGSYVSTYKITDSFTLPSATKNGYALTGWRADNSGNWSTMTYTVGNSVSGKYGNVKLTAVWKSNNYSVAFNANGGSGTTMSNQSFVYGTEQALTANAYYRDGFTFRGWALSATASDPDYLDKSYVSNLTTEANAVVTLYAIWGTNNYTIVYSTDSGTIRDTSYTRTFTVNDQIGLPTSVEKTGYEFAGWKPANDVGTWNSTTVYTGTINAGMIGNVTLQAQWTKLEFMITYEYDAANNGSIVGTRYTTNYDITTAITLPSAKKTGYGFNGWLSDGAGNWGVSTYSAGNISAGRYGNVTMTAQFAGVQYYVQFNGNGSTSGVMYNQSFTYGVPAALNPNEYARGGYEFKGWATSSTSTTAVYGDQGTVSNLSPTAGAIVNLYAVWEKINYTITYNTNGGAITTQGMETYSITDAVRLAVAQYAGYTSLGWRPAEDSGSWHSWDTYSGTINAGCYGNVTLVAQWSKDTYTITYDAQGGTMSGSYTTVYDIDTTIVLPEVSRTGYNFGGWLSDAAWNNVLVTNTAPAGAKGNVKLTAQWTRQTYYIRFNANGGFGNMNDLLMQFDVSQNLPRNEFSRDGYTFAGWAMSETGTAVYFDGDPVINLTQVNGATVDLFAQWSARKFTVAYNLNGAEGFMYSTSNIEMDGAPKTLRAYNGEEEVLIGEKRYKFGGWAYSKTAADNGIVAYADKAQFYMNESVLAEAEINWTTSQPTVTLYAVWTEQEIKLVIPEDATTVIDPDRRFIYGLKAGITQEELKTVYLNVIGNGSLVVDGTGAIGTGTKVRLVNNDTGDTLQEFEIVIFGDINGDGLINSTDYTRMRRISAGLEEVSFNSATGFACDMSNDGDINSTDLTFVRAVSSQLYQYDQANRRYVS